MPKYGLVVEEWLAESICAKIGVLNFKVQFSSAASGTKFFQAPNDGGSIYFCVQYTATTSQFF
jgi:hypothetical protein